MLAAKQGQQNEKMPNIIKGSKNESRFGVQSSKGFGQDENKRVGTATAGGNYGRPRTAAMLMEAAEAEANRPQTGAMGFPGTNKVLPKKNSLSRFAPG